IPRRLGHALTHDCRRPENAVEARVVHHLDDRGDAAALFPDERAPDVGELDFTRGIRSVAELVFESLNSYRVTRAVRTPSWDEEARKPAPRLGEHQERVGHRRRIEPLVPG